MTLRPDQLAARQAIYQAWAGGARRVLQQAPTAWGKGTLATSILADPIDGISVFISHLEEINLDIAQRVRSLTGIEPRILMGDNPEGPIDSPILIASEQTIARRLGGGATPAALGLVNVGRCIRDECHRQASESALLVSRACGPNALHLGLTATPERGDGRPLSFYDVLLPGLSPAELVTRGLIAPIVTFTPERPGPALAQDPVEAWPLRPDGSPRPGVLFARDIEHSKGLAARFYPERGIRAVHVEGDTPNRGAIIQRFNAGELDVLTCFRLFVEGVDVPRSEVTMLACSMSYPGPFLQSIGRSRRLYLGKLMAYLYDLTDNVMERAPDGTLRERLGMPDDERVFAIDGSAGIKLSQRPDVLPIRRCRVCHAMTRADRACLVCGARMAPPPKPAPKISKREMIERRHARQKLEGPDWEAWKAWVIDRAARGKTPQQIVAGWNYQHGSWPRFTVKQVLSPAPQRTEP